MRDYERDYWRAWRIKWIPKMLLFIPFAIGWFTVGTVVDYFSQRNKVPSITLRASAWACTSRDEHFNCTQWSEYWSAPHTYDAVTLPTEP